VIGCDGIFDKMNSDETIKCAWNSCNLDGQPMETRESKKASNVHNQCGLCVETVLKNSLYRQSLDNVTVVMICFQNFKRQVFGISKNSEREHTRNPSLSELNDKENSVAQGPNVKKYEFTSKSSASHSQTRASSGNPLAQQKSSAFSGKHSTQVQSNTQQQ
jgi:hypothetical protein